MGLDPANGRRRPIRTLPIADPPGPHRTTASIYQRACRRGSAWPGTTGTCTIRMTHHRPGGTAGQNQGRHTAPTSRVTASTAPHRRTRTTRPAPLGGATPRRGTTTPKGATMARGRVSRPSSEPPITARRRARGPTAHNPTTNRQAPNRQAPPAVSRPARHVSCRHAVRYREITVTATRRRRTSRARAKARSPGHCRSREPGPSITRGDARRSTPEPYRSARP